LYILVDIVALSPYTFKKIVPAEAADEWLRFRRGSQPKGGDAVPTQNSLLSLLEQNRGGCVSGQKAADTLGVSRAAIWKAAQALRRQGHLVEGQPGGGYRLAAQSDVLSAEAIRPQLHAPGCEVRVLGETASTNLEAKRWALSGAGHGAMVLAETQTAGRGRLGRAFESPPGGLYLSIVLRPSAGFGPAGLVTSAAGVAVCRSVQALFGLSLQIKWVNDLFLNGKKCCGILTEAATGVESGDIEFLVVGIGINYTTPPSAYTGPGRGIAVSLFPTGNAPTPRSRLAADIHTRLLGLFELLPKRDFLNEYRARSLVLGQKVTVMAEEPYSARAVAIDDDAQLVAELPDGARRTLAYGEIGITWPGPPAE
jgi:BirA family biotin operon repressor/biotin-[acetyl-CoA-carboxylase] ligase